MLSPEQFRSNRKERTKCLRVPRRRSQSSPRYVASNEGATGSILLPYVPRKNKKGTASERIF